MVRLVPSLEQAPNSTVSQQPQSTYIHPGRPQGVVRPTLKYNIPENAKGTGYLHFNANDAYVWALLPKPVRLRERFSVAGQPALKHSEGADRRVEALLEDESAPLEWIAVTTPNSLFIPTPSLGTQEVRPRANFFCGFEDRAQHPQYIIRGFEYITCIPRELPGELDWTPTIDDCSQPAGSAIRSEYLLLKRASIRCLEDIQMLYSRQIEAFLRRFPTETLAASLRNLLNQTIRMLSRISMTFREIMYTIAEFKRTCLDIQALIEYVTKYHPRTLGDNSIIHEPDPSLMGGFTENYAHAELFHRIGIPVFFIRPMNSITPHTLIGNEVRFSPSNIVTDDASPPFPPLWTGPPFFKVA
ncbi:hypothetical protein BKA70DRAFT_1444312 [Coprinopsis sp. MPI-PUGE-AT-0042]|nr:hypothetical protein BKA70DRAFT_1444312 [Coprinopsis sp. MPI-PUGE-AT-0042]